MGNFMSNVSRIFNSCSICGRDVERQGQRVAQGLQDQVRNDDAQQAIEMERMAGDA